MSKTDIWMPFYIADYLADTTRLTTEQHGAYILLILDYWRNGPPPNDAATLAQIARMPIDAWSNASSKVLAFFEQRDGMLVHKRIDQEKADADSNKDKKTAKAKAAASARWGKNAPSKAPGVPQALPKQCPSPSPSPSSNEDKKPSDEKSSATTGKEVTQEVLELTTEEQKDEKLEKPEYPSDFEVVWDIYPLRHGGNPKRDAFQKWMARIREGVSADRMSQGVLRYAEHCRAEGKVGTSYVMQAVRFFGNNKLYDEAWPAKSPSQGHFSGKFHVNQNDHSSTEAAMAKSMERHGIAMPDDDDPVDFNVRRP